MTGRWYPVFCAMLLIGVACSGDDNRSATGGATAPAAGRLVPFEPAQPFLVDIPMEEAARRKLLLNRLEDLTSLQVANSPIKVAIQKVLESPGVPVAFDDAAIAAEGNTVLESLVSMNVQEASARSILDQILEPHHLAIIFRDNLCVVTTQSVAESVDVTTVIYDATDLASLSDGSADASRLVAVIVRSIDPEMWVEQGGNHSVEPMITPKAVMLVIRAHSRTHAKVENLLYGLRRSGAAIVPAETLVDKSPQRDVPPATPTGGFGGGGFGGGGGGGGGFF